jgi:hypothetical protein
MIDLHQHVVIGDQIPQRPGDEKFQLTSFLPPQHSNLSTTDKQSESEVWGFFNSPFMTLRQTHSTPVAAAKAGISQATGYRLQADPTVVYPQVWKFA